MKQPRVSDAQSASYESGSDRPGSSRSRSALQFFIRTIPGGKTLVIHADSSDTIRSLHEKIHLITKIPVFEQRLIYRGKQLQYEQSLAECSIQNDAGLHLVGRMRSTEHPKAWKFIDDMISVVVRLLRGEFYPSAHNDIRTLMKKYFFMTHKERHSDATAASHLQIFMSSSAPAALVMLYASTTNLNRPIGESCIELFLSLIRDLSRRLCEQCAAMLLEFCKLLRRVGIEDHLYVACRSALSLLLDSVRDWIRVHEIFPFVSELGFVLCRDLGANAVGPLASNVGYFASFLSPLRSAIKDKVCMKGPVSIVNGRVCECPFFEKEVELLHGIFRDLLSRMDECLRRMEELLADGEVGHTRWSRYLAILKELNSISILYEGSEENFWNVMRLRKASLCVLITRYANRSDDNGWILKHKEELDFESRRHLAMVMLPKVKENYEERHQMLIDRARLLEESFEYIAKVEPGLCGGLFVGFKNEEATGPGVLREWFLLVCQALFNPERSLFVACPNDCRRFYPNQASTVDPMHLDYFSFAGRLIALALMHKVQVGIVFDRVFFLQLAGKSSISLEDIRDADPCLYNSCKNILQMDAEIIDSDALGLTFVREVEVLGSMKVVELCPGGKNIIVNSRNRDEYVNLLIQHQFVKSISEQVSRFRQGFSDMLCKPESRSIFFHSLELEDLDLMLHGSEAARAHTD